MADGTALDAEVRVDWDYNGQHIECCELESCRVDGGDLERWDGLGVQLGVFVPQEIV